MQELSKSAQIVQDFLKEKGHSCAVVELAKSVRTAKDAADCMGCTAAQIVNSLVFRTKETERPVLVLTSGANRVNEKLISEIVGEKIERADPAFVREVTGFAIGGVAPVAHKSVIETFIDKDLLNLGRVWAGAGTPNSVFELDGSDLPELTGGRVIAVA